MKGSPSQGGLFKVYKEKFANHSILVENQLQQFVSLCNGYLTMEHVVAGGPPTQNNKQL